MLLTSSADFFKNLLFQKTISGIPSVCENIWIQIRPDVMSRLIWVQTVCKGYQQMILEGKELIYPLLPGIIISQPKSDFQQFICIIAFISTVQVFLCCC